MPTDRRTRKRLATRQNISDSATRLFLERGFDNVTVDDIAAEADVGRMTVFNYFARKEDMFFDRDEEGREQVRQALQQAPTDRNPVETLRLLAHQWVAQGSPLLEFSVLSQQFVDTIEHSETLKARVRAIRDELAQLVAAELAQRAGRQPDDAAIRLVAGLLLATWSVALTQGHQTFARSQDRQAAEAIFLTLVDQGSIAVNAAMTGMPW